jgi:hypothetical protein
MPPAGIEPPISAGERSQNYALGRAATGTGTVQIDFWIVFTVHKIVLPHTVFHFELYRVFQKELYNFESL